MKSGEGVVHPHHLPASYATETLLKTEPPIVEKILRPDLNDI